MAGVGLGGAGMEERSLGSAFKLADPPKSPLKRGTLTEFSPLLKGGAWGGSESGGEV